MIVVVGATGVLGGATVRALRAAGHAVAAVTRDAGRAAPLARLGAEVRVADLTNPASLRTACRGAHAVFAAAHGMLGRGAARSERVDDAGHRALVDAAREAGVGHVVYTSVLGAAPDHPVDFWRTKARLEAYLRASGVPHTILRPSAFMEVHAHALLGRAVLAGRRAVILGRGENPTNFVAAADVARLAVRALTDPALVGETIEVGGPGNPTRNEVAALYGRLAGRVPTVTHVPPAVLRALAPVLRPLHPGVARVLHAAAVFEETDQTVPLEAVRRLEARHGITLTGIEAFVRARVDEGPGGPAGRA